MRPRLSALLVVAALAAGTAGCGMFDGGEVALARCALLDDVPNPTYDELNGAFDRLVAKDWKRITSPAYAGEAAPNGNPDGWKSQEDFTAAWRSRFDAAQWQHVLPTLAPGAVGKHRALLCAQNEEVRQQTSNETTKDRARVTNDLIIEEPLYALYVNGTGICQYGAASDKGEALHAALCPDSP